MEQTLSTPAAATRTAHHLKQNLREYGMLLSLVAIMIFFQIMTEGTLLQPLNLTNLVLQNSYIVIMALGMLPLIVAGHIDLSVGSVSGFVGALAAVLMVNYHWHFVPATVACLLVGAAIGAAQGWFIAYFKIPAFIVTLAGMLVFKGLALALLHGQSVGPFPIEFQKLSSGFIPDVFHGADLRLTQAQVEHTLSDKVSMCNFWANRLCCEAADRAMQVHGGLGYSRHKPFEHIYRHHRRYRITEGSEEIQKRKVAGFLFGYMGAGKY